MPETSIIIRTHNEEKHLGNLLQAISDQDYENHEVIIVDSGSSDKTLQIAAKFKVKIINIESRDFTFGHALNVGCEESNGRYLVFVSAHILPANSHWLSSLIAPFEDEKVAMVYGRQLGAEKSKFSEKMDFKRLFLDSVINYNVPIEYSNNANSAIRKSLWQSCPFDEYLFGLEDIDWARHMAGTGYLIRYEPKAAAHHIHEEKWHQIFNRYRREAIAAIRIGLKQPPQSGVTFFWLFIRLFDDIIHSFLNWSPGRLEEVLQFRYYQWKGSRQGWFYDKALDLEKDKQDIFFREDNLAALIEGKHKARLTKISLPEMKPGDILIKVDYVGVCRTDLEVYEGTLGYYRDGVAEYPIVPGHEFSGTIVKVGANNKYREWFKAGDKVVGECILSHGEKSDRKEVGVINHNGAYAELIVMPGDAIHKIPDNLDSKTAVLAEPLGVVLRAIRRIKPRIKEQSSLAVIGAGPIGNLCAQMFSLEGHKVTVYDMNAERLKLLKGKVHDTKKNLDDLAQFDAIVEVTGVREVLEQVLKQSRFDSTVLLLGFPYGDINYNFENLVGNEKVIVGSVGAEKKDFPEALKLLPKLDTEDFTKIVMPLKDFKKAWELQKTSKYLKILLKPS